jgi:hypothetical protein
MNVNNMMRLINRLTDRKNPVNFTMRNFVECFHRDAKQYCPVKRSTVIREFRKHPHDIEASIIGYAAIMAWVEDGGRGLFVWDMAQKWLGLTDDETDSLCYGHWSGKSLMNITKRDAVAKLRRMVKANEAAIDKDINGVIDTLKKLKVGARRIKNPNKYVAELVFSKPIGDVIRGLKKEGWTQGYKSYVAADMFKDNIKIRVETATLGVKADKKATIYNPVVIGPRIYINGYWD